MKRPWEGKTGLAKAAAVLATVFGIALGLCGVNYVGVVTILPTANLNNGLATALMIGAWIEVAAMALSGAGLVMVCIIFVVREIGRSFTGRE